MTVPESIPAAVSQTPLKVAVLVPCFNEATTIAQVVADFRAALPDGTVYVFDNNSTDDTVRRAREAGARVGAESRQGKGNVVRRMFADIEADIYVLVDGDGTYDAAAAPGLVRRLTEEGVDLVNGMRVGEAGLRHRTGHQFGNLMLSSLVSWIFGSQVRDMLSGYKVLSRRFVKSFPAMSRGFEIETELTVHALELRLPTVEMETAYRSRPEGSVSKLSTLGDGIRILRTIVKLVREERPFQFFTMVALVLAIGSLVLFAPVFETYLETGLVPRLPTVVLSMGLMLSAMLSFATGLMLDTVTRGRQEAKRFAYLSVRGPLDPDAMSRSGK